MYGYSFLCAWLTSMVKAYTLYHLGNSKWQTSNSIILSHLVVGVLL